LGIGLAGVVSYHLKYLSNIGNRPQRFAPVNSTVSVKNHNKRQINEPLGWFILFNLN